MSIGDGAEYRGGRVRREAGHPCPHDAAHASAGVPGGCGQGLRPGRPRHGAGGHDPGRLPGPGGGSGGGRGRNGQALQAGAGPPLRACPRDGARRRRSATSRDPPTAPTCPRPRRLAGAPFDPATGTAGRRRDDADRTRSTWRRDGTRTAAVERPSRALPRLRRRRRGRTFDLTLVAGPGGSLVAKSAPAPTTLGGKADGAVASVDTAAGPISLRHPGATARSAATTDKDAATFAKALPGGRGRGRAPDQRRLRGQRRAGRRQGGPVLRRRVPRAAGSGGPRPGHGRGRIRRLRRRVPRHLRICPGLRRFVVQGRPRRHHPRLRADRCL